MHCFRFSLPFILTLFENSLAFKPNAAYFALNNPHGVENAIRPTAPGQIGVNPVPPDPAAVSSASQYVGVDPTASVNGEISVSTVATSTGVLLPGDINVAMSSKFKNTLTSIARQADAACKLAKRDSTGSCIIDFLKSQTKKGGLLDYPDLSAVPDVVSHIASDGAALLAKQETAQVAGLGAAVAMAFTVWYLYHNHNDHLVPGSIRFSKANMGNIKPLITASATKTSSTPCPTGTNGPRCEDDNCKAQIGELNCESDQYKGCDCLGQAVAFFYRDDTVWLDAQQVALKQLEALPSPSPSWCHHGADNGGDGSQGQKQPSEWCACGSDPLQPSVTYSVASSTASDWDLCPYTGEPGPTVTFSTFNPMATGPTPTVGPVTCYPDGTHKHCYLSDVNPSRANSEIRTFCQDNGNKDVKPGDKDLEGWGKWFYDDTDYHVSVGWIPGCVSNAASQNVGEPIPGQKCTDLLLSAVKCNNRGRGGYLNVGCVTYAFSPRNKAGLYKSDNPCAPSIVEPEAAPMTVEIANGCWNLISEIPQ